MPLASVVSHWLNGWGEDQGGGAPGAYILNGRIPQTRRPKKKKNQGFPVVEIVMAPDVTVILDEPLADLAAATRARHKAEDDLLLIGLL